MNSNSIEVTDTDSGKSVNLPKPDRTNITVLTSKLPNKPILPWTHFDSPWLDKEEEEEASTEQETSTENQDNQPEATENQPEPSATNSNSSVDSDTLQTATQQTPTPEISPD